MKSGYEYRDGRMSFVALVVNQAHLPPSVDDIE